MSKLTDYLITQQKSGKRVEISSHPLKVLVNGEEQKGFTEEEIEDARKSIILGGEEWNTQALATLMGGTAKLLEDNPDNKKFYLNTTKRRPADVRIEITPLEISIYAYDQYTSVAIMEETIPYSTLPLPQSVLAPLLLEPCGPSKFRGLIHKALETINGVEFAISDNERTPEVLVFYKGKVKGFLNFCDCEIVKYKWLFVRESKYFDPNISVEELGAQVHSFLLGRKP